LKINWQGRPLLAVSSVMFGAMATLTRAASRGLDASEVTFLRFAISFVGTAAIALAWRGSFRPHNWRLIVLRGFSGGVAVLLYFVSIKHSGAGPATLMNFTSPVWAALFAAVFLGERPTLWLIVGLLLALGGSFVVAGEGLFAGADAARAGTMGVHLGIGEIAGLASAVCAGAAVTSIRALRPTDNALTIFLTFNVAGMLVAAPLAAWGGWSWPGAAEWWLLAGVGVTAFFGQLIFTHALGFVQVGQGAVLSNLTAVMAFVFAWLLLGEPIPARSVAGGALIVTGVVLAVQGEKAAGGSPSPSAEA
jgi:drug/metabolite transporter (DMT)-like permease